MPSSAVPSVAIPPILPRSEWDDGEGPTGPLEPEEVKFLLIHHTGEPGNDYESDAVAPLIRSIYRYHTSPAKGWPDIAYNFMVDKFGRIFEARSGSLAGPIRGSATGGNQGYAQLCCFLGNFEHEPPTDAAQASMIALLSWLAYRYDLPVEPGSQTTFASLGSNRWPQGEIVSVDLIAAHRDVSQTTCPGDACMELVRVGFPTAVAQQLAVAKATTTTSTSQPPISTPSTAVSTTGAPLSRAAEGTNTPPTSHESSLLAAAAPSGRVEDHDQRGFSITSGALLATAAALLGAVITSRNRRAD